MAKYEKNFLSFEQQADRYIKRGLICDKEELIKTLKEIGYYRLSGYLYPYRIKEEKYAEGTKLEDILYIYNFDRELKLIIFDAIEKFEIYMRVQLSHELARQTGTFGYNNRKSLPRLSKKEYKQFIKKCKSLYKTSKEKYIEHFKEKYGDSHKLPPYWMLVGIHDLGALSKLYKGAPSEARSSIAKKLNISAKALESWLWTLSSVRNICAHHSRLWNRVIGRAPKTQKSIDKKIPKTIYRNRIAYIIEVLKIFNKTLGIKNASWEIKLRNLLKKYNNIDRRKMGYS